MSIFSRLSDIVASNLNALLDRVENPEALLVQVIREMEEGLAAARRYAALAIAAARRAGAGGVAAGAGTWDSRPWHARGQIRAPGESPGRSGRRTRGPG